MVHGLLPFCLTTSGSRRIRALHGKLSRHPGRNAGFERWSHDASDGVAFDWSI